MGIFINVVESISIQSNHIKIKIFLTKTPIKIINQKMHIKRMHCEHTPFEWWRGSNLVFQSQPYADGSRVEPHEQSPTERRGV